MMLFLRNLIMIILTGFGSFGLSEKLECPQDFSKIKTFRVAGDYQWHAADIGYEISEHFDANNSEFYVDAFGRGSFSNNGVGANWIEALIKLNPAILKSVRNVGMYVKWSNVLNSKEKKQGLILAFDPTLDQSASRRIVFKHSWNLFGTEMDVTNEVNEIAFFIDVERDDRIVRLWFNDGPINFTIYSIYSGHEVSTVSSGDTTVEYVFETSPIFNQKRASNF